MLQFYLTRVLSSFDHFSVSSLSLFNSLSTCLLNSSLTYCVGFVSFVVGLFINFFGAYFVGILVGLFRSSLY